ncbi:MAG: alpha-amylase family glycosyl hydrolase, partial [Rhodothermales bacterium]|nr:alpha-amylase family glycosyl hydrolase [Rhodothermales bacterium]
RVVIDGVWNHTGQDFFAFADVRQNGPDSPYRDWYIIKSWDDPSTPEDEFDHQGWWGHKPLPEFADSPDGKDLHPGPKRYVFDATRRWMDPDGDGDPSDGIAGWRLDVVPDMPIGFWADWNAYARSINPDVYTVAEIWHDAARDIERGGFSGTMNYHAFAMPVKGFLVDNMVGAGDFVEMLKGRAEAYGDAYRFGALNLVDSHDTPRIASMIVNRESEYTESDVFDYDRDGSGRDPAYDVRKPNGRERRIQRMIALVQATHLGAPMIYYGTESGMWGADDPDDRMPMVWDDMEYDVQDGHPRGRQRPADTVAFDEETFSFYRDAFRARHDREVLRRGSFDPIGSSDVDAAAAYARRLGGVTAVVVMNRSDETGRNTISPPANWSGSTVALSSGADEDVRIMENDGNLVVEVAPLTAALLESATSTP